MEGKAFHPDEVQGPFEHTDGHTAARRDTIRPGLARNLVVGFTGGLVGTIVMDLFGAGLFLVMGGPASLSFSIIGDAAAAFFAMLGVNVVGGFPLGALLHYLIGIVLGILFGAILSHATTFTWVSPRRVIALGVLYVEGMSLPMLATAAIVLRMTEAETAQWFGVSFVMHLVYGLVLGTVFSRYVKKP